MKGEIAVKFLDFLKRNKEKIVDILVLALIIVFLLMIITKRGALSFELFRVGYNFFYFLMVLYVYGLWAIAVRKNYQVSRPLAFVGTLVPVLGLLIFGLIFDKIAFSKIGKFIT